MRRIVSDERDSSPIDVLHIRPDCGEGTPQVDAWLESASLTCEVCGDVYRGLARLCVAGSSQGEKGSVPRAIVVCVDDLGALEMEFFSQARRIQRGVPVYVYGQQRHESRVARAIEMGAAGRVTWETICSIATPSASSAGERFGSDDAERTESETFEDESTASPARVPWVRYADEPVRAAPKRTPPAGRECQESGVANTQSSSSPSGPDAPLLTEAELRALLADDIAAIAPHERRDVGPDDLQGDKGVT